MIYGLHISQRLSIYVSGIFSEIWSTMRFINIVNTLQVLFITINSRVIIWMHNKLYFKSHDLKASGWLNKSIQFIYHHLTMVSYHQVLENYTLPPHLIFILWANDKSIEHKVSVRPPHTSWSMGQGHHVKHWIWATFWDWIKLVEQ